jgi:hypothetical protein
MPVVSQQGQHWINAEKARYYRVVLEKDLFGTWSLIACWGALHSRRGGMRVTALASLDAGIAAQSDGGSAGMCRCLLRPTPRRDERIGCRTLGCCGLDPVVVIDFETTPFSPDDGGRATDIVALLIQDGRIVEPILFPLQPLGEMNEAVRLIDSALDRVVDQEAASEHARKYGNVQRKNILRADFSVKLMPQDANYEKAGALLERIRSERPDRSSSQSKKRQRTRKGSIC